MYQIRHKSWSIVIKVLSSFTSIIKGCQDSYFASFTFVSSIFLKVDRLDYHQAVAASFMKWVPISAAVVETADPLGLNRDESKKSKKSRKKKVRQQLQQPAAISQL